MACQCYPDNDGAKGLAYGSVVLSRPCELLLRVSSRRGYGEQAERTVSPASPLVVVVPAVASVSAAGFFLGGMVDRDCG